MPRNTRVLSTLDQLHLATFHYDFAVDGGIGRTIESGGETEENLIPIPGTIPAGSIIFDVIINFIEDFTSEGLTLGLLLWRINSIGELSIVELISDGESVSDWSDGISELEILGLPRLVPADSFMALRPEVGEEVLSGKMAVHVLYFMSPPEPEEFS